MKITWKMVLWRVLAYALMITAIWGVLEVSPTLPWYQTLGGLLMLFIGFDVLNKGKPR